MVKTVFVQAFGEPVFGHDYKTVKVPTGEKKRSIFGDEKEITKKEYRRVQTGTSDSQIDGVRLANDIDAATTALQNEGYEVLTITPVMSGKYAYHVEPGSIESSVGFLRDGYKVSGKGSWAYGYGYSYTEGVLITARKISSHP